MSKHSQTSTALQAVTVGVKKQDPNLLIMVNQVNSAIHALHDTIMTGFKDKFTIVSDTTKVLYDIPGFMEKLSKTPKLGMVFAQNKNLAAMFLLLADSEQVKCATYLYNEHYPSTMLSNELSEMSVLVAGPSSL